MARIVAGVVVTLMAIIALIVVLSMKRIISFELAMLMLVALLGLYFGFGVLIAVYRFISKLE